MWCGSVQRRRRAEYRKFYTWLTKKGAELFSNVIGEAFMPNIWAAAVCAAGIWVIVIAAVNSEPVKRPVGEAWVVTASEKMASRPALVRAHVPFRTADIR
jgi:hypothetical protein